MNYINDNCGYIAYTKEWLNDSHIKISDLLDDENANTLLLYLDVLLWELQKRKAEKSYIGSEYNNRYYNYLLNIFHDNYIFEPLYIDETVSFISGSCQKISKGKTLNKVEKSYLYRKCLFKECSYFMKDSWYYPEFPMIQFYESFLVILKKMGFFKISKASERVEIFTYPFYILAKFNLISPNESLIMLEKTQTMPKLMEQGNDFLNLQECHKLNIEGKIFLFECFLY